MTLTRKIFFLVILIIVSSKLIAQELLHEAKISPERPGMPQISWQVYFSGGCSGNVLLTAHINGQYSNYQLMKDQNSIDTIVAKLLKKCPKAEQIHLLLENSIGGRISTESYRMFERSGWRVMQMPIYDAPNNLMDFQTREAYTFTAKGSDLEFTGTITVNPDGATKGYLNRYNLNTKVGSFSGKVPARLAGQFSLREVRDDQNKLRTSYVSSGIWHHYGLGEECRVYKDGYAIWGQYSLSLGQTQELKLTYCPEDGAKKLREEVYTLEWKGNDMHSLSSAAVRENLYSMFSPAPGSLIEVEVADNNSVEPGFKGAYSLQWDAENSLSRLKFSNSKFLFTDKGIDFYLAEDVSQYHTEVSKYPQRDAVFVAVHNKQDDEAVIDVELFPVKEFKTDVLLFPDVDLAVLSRGPERPSGLPKYLLKESAIHYYGEVIAPKLAAAAKGVDPGIVLHYTKSDALYNIYKRMARHKGTPKHVLPVITVTLEKFSHSPNQWRPDYEFKNPKNPSPITFRQGEGYSLSSALKSRQLWTKALAESTIGLNNEQIIAVTNKRRQERDDELRKIAHNRGLEYRDFAYWTSYKEKLFLKNIFDGESYDGMIADTNWFAHFYNSFQTFYYYNCEHKVSDRFVTIKYYEVVTMRRAYEADSTHTNFINEVRIRNAMWPTFEHYNSVAESPISIGYMLGNMLNHDVGQMLNDTASIVSFFAEIRHDIDRIFENDCDSDFLTQFDENLHLIATKRPKLQRRDH